MANGLPARVGTACGTIVGRAVQDELTQESKPTVQKVIKCGNSLAVILPKESAASVGIDVGILVETSVEGGRVVVQPVGSLSRPWYAPGMLPSMKTLTV